MQKDVATLVHMLSNLLSFGFQTLLTEVGYVYIWEQNSMQKVVWPTYRAGTKVDTEVRTRLKLLPIKLYAPSHLVFPSFSSLILVGVMGDILASQACWENQRRF